MTRSSFEGGGRPRPRTIFSELATVVLLAGLWLGLAAAASAHGGQARLILEPPTINPGGTVVVQGDDLSADDAIRLVIVGDGQEIELGTRLSDGQGHLTQAFVVPPDVAVGTYQLQAVGSAGDVIANELIVAGTPIVPEDGGGGHDAGEPLLVPLPSGWQGSLLSPAPPIVPTAPVDRGAGFELPVALAALAALIAFGLGGLALTMLARRRRSA